MQSLILIFLLFSAPLFAEKPVASCRWLEQGQERSIAVFQNHAEFSPKSKCSTYKLNSKRSYKQRDVAIVEFSLTSPTCNLDEAPPIRLLISVKTRRLVLGAREIKCL